MPPAAMLYTLFCVANFPTYYFQLRFATHKKWKRCCIMSSITTLLDAAMTRPSKGSQHNYERLEFLGADTTNLRQNTPRFHSNTAYRRVADAELPIFQEGFFAGRDRQKQSHERGGPSTP